MKITVKSAKVLKTGESKNGAWSLIGVTSDDGTNYATFHKGAENLAPGAVIDIGEVIIKEGKCSFKEYKIISEAPAQPNGKPDMTPDMWDEKARKEQWSRECNTCFMGIMELAASQTYQQNIEADRWGRVAEVLDAALDWAMEHFNTDKTVKEPPQKSPPDRTASTPEANKDETQGFANLGEFYTACMEKFKLPKSKVDAETEGCNLTTEEGRVKAWNQLTALYDKDPDKLFK